MTTTIGLGDGLVRLARTAGPEPRDMAAPAGRRHAALEWIETHGFPTARDEDWRYLPLGPVLTAALELPDPTETMWSSASLEAEVPDLGGPRLVFVNGCFMQALSRLAALPDGVIVSRTFEDEKRNDPDDDASDYRHAFDALNAALATDDLIIRVAPRVISRDPIHLVHLSVPTPAPLVTSPRTILVAGNSSRIHLVETFMGTKGSTGLTNAITRAHLERGALVELDRLQDEAENRWHLSLLDVRQAEDSHLQACSVGLGASIARHEVRVRLCGDRAEATLDGLFLPRNEQYHDQPIFVEHLGRNTRSRQRYQGVADGNGHGIFNGRVLVGSTAQGTDAEQMNRNLLLSDQAEIDTRPRLEIFGDDVRCTHGATVGRLDETALYYLRSRGIPEQSARAMLVHAAVDQVVDRMSSAALRVDVARRVVAAVDPAGVTP